MTGQSVQWWTFAGERASTWLAHELAPLRRSANAFDGLSITLDEGVNFDHLHQQLAEIDPSNMSISEWVSGETVEQLKFAACLPASLALRTVSKRLEDTESVRMALDESLSAFSG